MPLLLLLLLHGASGHGFSCSKSSVSRHQASARCPVLGESNSPLGFTSAPTSIPYAPVKPIYSKRSGVACSGGDDFTGVDTKGLDAAEAGAKVIGREITSAALCETECNNRDWCTGFVYGANKGCWLHHLGCNKPCLGCSAFDTYDYLTLSAAKDKYVLRNRCLEMIPNKAGAVEMASQNKIFLDDKDGSIRLHLPNIWSVEGAVDWPGGKKSICNAAALNSSEPFQTSQWNFPVYTSTAAWMKDTANGFHGWYATKLIVSTVHTTRTFRNFGWTKNIMKGKCSGNANAMCETVVKARILRLFFCGEENNASGQLIKKCVSKKDCHLKSICITKYSDGTVVDPPDCWWPGNHATPGSVFENHHSGAGGCETSGCPKQDLFYNSDCIAA